MVKLHWTRQAYGDLMEIVDYISDDNPQAAQELKDEIEMRVNGLPAYPKKYARSKRAPGYRQLTVRANYLVFYRLITEKAPAIIEIAAVIHARRNWPN